MVDFHEDLAMGVGSRLVDALCRRPGMAFAAAVEAMLAALKEDRVDDSETGWAARSRPYLLQPR